MNLWIFGYGSLLWNPGFVPVAAHRAVLHDYHRSFCMLSVHHRGTPDAPGLVLALDAVPGGQCTGMAFQVAETETAHVLSALRERELVSSAYLERPVVLHTDDGPKGALAYVIDPDHAQYVQLDLETQARMIARSTGGRGPNSEYLFRTADHLAQMGIVDPDMVWLTGRVRAILGTV
ncbi:cation transport protein ChaC [Loktanella fryxellensis]|uniref:glutathione-specific gamma-glutamylcyclotransferase n=1 Tax=Loktanella fryxellensis TaxID=245187 RepID=A0A1H8DE95_9RHOB|nr:gamma-glutamylcyclotransferase [Loktanella fryxellensis]SEN04848.1 cation transport protein ChaC [Loktanella fryxellensis]